MFSALLLSTFLTPPIQGNWDVKDLGPGGQPSIVSNDKGMVAIASHQPGTLWISRDWGETFPETRLFQDALGDLRLSNWGDRLHLTYLSTGVPGVRNHYSFDAGKTLRDGGKIAGDFDRASVVNNPNTSELSLITSEGYPSGPASKGVFVFRSTDYGRTFSKPTRVDNEAATDQPVDPVIGVGADGTMYAMWSVSKNNENIASIMFAISSNGGKLWRNVTELAKLSTKGDTQERWMLGGMVYQGDRVAVYYPDYEERGIGDAKRQVLVTHVRFSDTKGGTFTGPLLALAPSELEETDKLSVPYRQTMPSMAFDAAGNLHFAFIDNREDPAEDPKQAKWQARYSVLAKGAKEFGPSESISPPFAAVRPPLELIGCAVDSKYVYVTWAENPGSTEPLDYRGMIKVGRKSLKAEQDGARGAGRASASHTALRGFRN